MTICLITFQYPPMVNGGVAGAAYRLATNLVKLGLTVHVIAPGQNGISNSIKPTKEDGVFVHRTYPDLGTYYGDRELLNKIGDYIIDLHREVDFDLVHGMFLIPVGILATVVAGEINRPLVVSIRGKDVESMRYCQMFSSNVRWVLEQATCVTSVTSDLLNKAHKISKIKKSKVISNAVDPSIFDGESLHLIAESSGWRFRSFLKRIQDAKDTGGVVIGTVGIFRPVKGFDVLLEAFRQLKQTHAHIHLLCVGDFIDVKTTKVWTIASEKIV